ncbi:ferritin-like domain-containing protein [Ferruginibacter paludis]|uniref:ferritin-like domain-containing protein n=1 Tax=Ferruginibacter paludis TaxID=1310417 RepID=UPI0025B4116C|nr:ferritin-like domain-containing protein [Ferruginibacter paludis]MDN3657259.1 ferritin-like domain-containing protein [Ferruginibacter paludis]
MKTSKQWIEYFYQNALRQRVDWHLEPAVSVTELSQIVHSLQAWQLGETSDGAHLIHAATLYASRINDPHYVQAVQLFIKEEQKHGNNLGKYLDAIHQPRISKNWGDTLFRKIRYFNTSMEIWTLAVITVESAAQIFYQALKNATNCTLLQQICTDILIDEAYHIHFQAERMAIIFNSKPADTRIFSRFFYPLFFFATSLLVWFAHQKLFKAGGTNFSKYWRSMQCKYKKTLHDVALSKRLAFTSLRTPQYQNEMEGMV